MKTNRRITTLLASLAIGLVAVGTILFLRPETADAGIYDAHNETVYAEQWVVHANNYTGGCDFFRDWFIEPSYNTCDKTLSFDMPNVSGATKVEIYIDLWRNRDIPSAVFSINGHTNHQTNVGTDWGRTPYIAEIPKSEFQVGSNEITFKDLGGGEYHVHDVAFRVYESSVNVPTGSLTGITASNGFFDPTNPAAAGSDLNIDSDQLVLTATVTSENADYVEFHAFYDGYDEDNDGVFRDWHNRGNTLLH
ncbi:MAG: hypothetical protein KC419_07890, partial [Anaerolineales bacterium]|nr:hypothetical protein [Anaerolineales bacterium]